MKTVDLIKILKPYKSGWVAINQKNKVIAHAETFAAVSNKVKKNKDIFLVPVSQNYFGFITTIYDRLF